MQSLSKPRRYVFAEATVVPGLHKLGHGPSGCPPEGSKHYFRRPPTTRPRPQRPYVPSERPTLRQLDNRTYSFAAERYIQYPGPANFQPGPTGRRVPCIQDGPDIRSRQACALLQARDVLLGNRIVIDIKRPRTTTREDRGLDMTAPDALPLDARRAKQLVVVSDGLQTTRSGKDRWVVLVLVGTLQLTKIASGHKSEVACVNRP